MKQRGQTLIGLLAVIAIIAILAVTMLRGTGGSKSARKDGLGNTMPGLVKLKARDEECRSNLDQIRQFISVAAATGEGPAPKDLEEARVPSGIQKCPIGKESYVYDNQTGTVHCPHPGHEKF